ncbi:MAG: DUF4469 domain-containing protein [bacterium]|jgi:hypothetical protein
MPLQYEVVRNVLTKDESYQARLRNRKTVETSELLKASTKGTRVSSATAAGVLQRIFNQVKIELLKGNSVTIPGLGTFGTAIHAKLNTPHDLLPKNPNITIFCRPSPALTHDIREGITLERVEPASQDPELRSLTSISGTLELLSARDVLELRGERLKFDEKASDEGVFFVNQLTGSEARCSIYLYCGERKLLPIVPDTIEPGAIYRIEVRTRRRNSRRLRTTQWPEPFNACCAFPEDAV